MWQRDRYFWYSLCIVTTHFDKLCILQYLSQLQFLKCVSTLHDLLLLGGGSIHKLEGEVVPSIFALFRGRFGNEGRLQWMVKYSYINRVVEYLIHNETQAYNVILYMFVILQVYNQSFNYYMNVWEMQSSW